jgi:RNA polymerase sigma-70 factor (ECF subfamily)
MHIAPIAPIAYSPAPASGLFRGGTSEYVARYAPVRAVRRQIDLDHDSVNMPFISADPSASDLSLVGAMARGEERAAALLYDRHGAVMYGLALRMVNEAADAEEVVLDAFAQAWREANRYDTVRGSVVGWLTTIVRSRALDAARARGRRFKAVDAAGTAFDAPSSMGEPTPLPDRMVEESERAVAVTAALQALPQPQRLAIELAFFEGLTHPEVAERLREPLGTVKTRIRLGMLKLRDMLGSLAPEPAS